MPPFRISNITHRTAEQRRPWRTPRLTGSRLPSVETRENTMGQGLPSGTAFRDNGLVPGFENTVRDASYWSCNFLGAVVEGQYALFSIREEHRKTDCGPVGRGRQWAFTEKVLGSALFCSRRGRRTEHTLVGREDNRHSRAGVRISTHQSSYHRTWRCSFLHSSESGQ